MCQDKRVIKVMSAFQAPKAQRELREIPVLRVRREHQALKENQVHLDCQA